MPCLFSCFRRDLFVFSSSSSSSSSSRRQRARRKASKKSFLKFRKRLRGNNSGAAAPEPQERRQQFSSWGFPLQPQEGATSRSSNANSNAAGAAVVGDRQDDAHKNDKDGNNSTDPPDAISAAAGAAGGEDARKKPPPPGAVDDNRRINNGDDAKPPPVPPPSGAGTDTGGSTVVAAPVPADADDDSKVYAATTSTQPLHGSSRRGNLSSQIRFSALQQSTGVLDMYTYHRGREGVELRDERTGELLCDVEPTDTNHNVDEPRVVAQVTVKFPLENEPADDDQTDDVATAADDFAPGDNTDGIPPEDRKKAAPLGIRYYKETVAWDLTDPEVATPVEFAADVAENFGLSYAQTMDLAESIQDQLRSFVQDNCTFATPLILKDSSGNKVHDAPPAVAHTLYGDVTGPEDGGLPLSRTKRPSGTIRRSVSKVSSTADKMEKPKAPSSKAPTKRKFSRTIDAKTDEECRQEVLKRLREESRRRIEATTTEDQLVGELVISGEMQCHLCSNPREQCRNVACGVPGHSFCDTHLVERFGLGVHTDPLPLTLEHCPICSLTCTCSSCTQKLDVTWRQFRSKWIKIGSKAPTPRDTTFLNLFQYVRALDIGARQVKEEREEEKEKAKRKRSILVPVRTVDKLPVWEFPREVCEGVDIDPGTENDYRTVFSASGMSILRDVATRTSDVSAAFSPSHATVQEDGSIDFCMACRNHGNLLCCDFCPRAYHAGCLETDTQTSELDWKCPACRREDDGIPEEELDGEPSLSLICTAFKCSFDTASENEKTGLRVLSMIHQMVLLLMDYDFGYVFRQPVDLEQVPEYKTIVSNPMDLGTIASELSGGGYTRRAEEKGIEWVICSVLKDIELVWHNCYSFNCLGSAIYRMADVQRACAGRIQQRSFDYLLSEGIKKEVEDFVLACERQRATTAMSANATDPPRSPATPKARPKITVSKKGQNAQRYPIAILDPDTGLLVKIYTSMNAACSAIDLISSRNYVDEWDFGGHCVPGKLTRLIKDAEPSYTIFGYRWLRLSDLKEGKVAFAETDVKTRKGKKRRKKPNTDEGGRTTEEKCGEPIVGSSVVTVKQETDPLVTLHPSFGGQKDPRVEEASFVFNSVDRFVKESLVTGHVLRGFRSLEDAYNDWLQSIENCTAEDEESRTIEMFKSFYLDGVRNVEGLSWKTNQHHEGESQSFVIDSTREEKKVQGFDGDNGVCHTVIGDSASGSQLVDSNRLADRIPSNGGIAAAELVSPLVTKNNSSENNIIENSKVCAKE